jgi:UDP-N-acetylglucosamine 2-epimerase (non-hydrolysing)
MIDTLVYHLPAARELNMPVRFGFDSTAYGFVTLHRPSNVDIPSRLSEIVELLDCISRAMPLVFPIHPRCRASLVKSGLDRMLEDNPQIRILEPLAYLENLSAMQGAKVVLTDSGGIQEETSFLGIPCLTLRENTERPVTVTNGTNTLIGSDFGVASSLVGECLAGKYKKGSSIPGWDGRAAYRVIEALESHWCLK